jgi:hypothetical protein
MSQLCKYLDAVNEGGKKQAYLGRPSLTLPSVNEQSGLGWEAKGGSIPGKDATGEEISMYDMVKGFANGSGKI